MCDEGKMIKLQGGALSIYKRGKWYHARVYVGNREYVYCALNTDDEIQARQRGLEFFHEVKFKQSHGMPLNTYRCLDVMDQWIAHLHREVSQGYSKFMLRNHLRALKYWREYVGNKDLHTINNQVLKGYESFRKNYWQTHTPNHSSVKTQPQPKTIRMELNLFKGMLKWAWEQGWAAQTPFPAYSMAVKLERVRPAIETHEYIKIRREMNWWTRANETERTLTFRRQFQNLFVILALSGMRPGEAYNLKISDVSWFRDGLGRTLARLHVRGKTGSRDVVPRATAVPWLRKQLKLREGADGGEFLFKGFSDDRITTLQVALDRILAKADCTHSSDGRKFSLYSLRHRYITMMLRHSRADVFLIARNCGTSVNMISRFYGKQATPLSAAERLA
jgi:integrase